MKPNLICPLIENYGLYIDILLDELSAQIWPGPVRAEPQQPARPGQQVGLDINFTKNMYLEHKPLKFSYPKSLCGVVGIPWVLLGTLVGFWESLIDFDKNSRI